MNLTESISNDPPVLHLCRYRGRGHHWFLADTKYICFSIIKVPKRFLLPLLTTIKKPKNIWFPVSFLKSNINAENGLISDQLLIAESKFSASNQALRWNPSAAKSTDLNVELGPPETEPVHHSRAHSHRAWVTPVRQSTLIELLFLPTREHTTTTTHLLTYPNIFLSSVGFSVNRSGRSRISSSRLPKHQLCVLVRG